jgi:hypothetical protein
VQKAYLGAGTDRPAPAATAGAPAAHEPTPSQIAAAALARLPYVATSGGQGGARRSADELISGSIDDLVRRAAKTQAKHVEVVRGAAGGTRPAGGGAARSSERLRSALAEIERAARDARLGTAPPTAPEQAKNDRRDKDEPGNGSGQGKRL